MVQALCTEDGSFLQGITVQNTYTKLRQVSKKTFMVVRNNTAYSQTLQKKTPVARAVAASPVPEPLEEVQLLEGADKSHDPHTPRLMARPRHGKLFDKFVFRWLGFLGPRAGRYCPLAPGQIPQCVLNGSIRIGMYPFHRTYDKSYG